MLFNDAKHRLRWNYKSPIWKRWKKWNTRIPHDFFLYRKERRGRFVPCFVVSQLWASFKKKTKKKINKPHEDSMFIFRMPSWNGTANYLILCMWALVPCGGEHCSPVSRIKSTLKDNSSCPSSRRAQPEEKGGCSNCSEMGSCSLLLQFSERPGDRAQRWSTTPSLYLPRGTLGFSCRKG